MPKSFEQQFNLWPTWLKLQINFSVHQHKGKFLIPKAQ